MTPDCDEDDEEVDDDFKEDMEALRRACMLTGAKAEDVVSGDLPEEENCLALCVSPSTPCYGGEGGDSDLDDFQMLQQLQRRFCDSVDALHIPSPLTIIPSLSDDDEAHDLETLLALRRRFASYDKNGEKEDKNDAECFPEPGTTYNYSSFPEPARLLFDAIKKNRLCQKFIRNKLVQMEARMEENKMLRERVKILKNFQLKCKKLTGRMFSIDEDPRVQLISSGKTVPFKECKLNDKPASAKYKGPRENAHVANYRLAFPHFPLSWKQKPWSKTESDNLHKGLRQQFQEMLLQASMDRSSESESSHGMKSLDGIVSLIRDVEITPSRMREFVPKVNWDHLASLYVPSRPGAECESRWLNVEDPLINQGPWTKQEEKKILLTVMEKGMTNWIDIAASLRTNRTPFDCLAHFQRSLNANIMKREWTKDEDDQLRSAVEMFGESNWQSVASTLPGRTGSQCSNRWMKSLHPRRSRKGRWTEEEDRRLKVAVKLFGPKNWEKIAGFVPGRMQAQCRERWVNSLDPSLNWNEWTEEEDALLIAGIGELGYRWSKIAAKYLPRRTDNQCTRRWKILFPGDVPLLQAARRTKKAAFISNFVDREDDRPALGPGDFVQLPSVPAASSAHPPPPLPSKKRKQTGTPENEPANSSPRENVKKRGRKRKSTRSAAEIAPPHGLPARTSCRRSRSRREEVIRSNLSNGNLPLN